MRAQKGLQVDGQGWATSLVSRGVLLCQPSTCSREGARDKLVPLIETSICPHSSATLPPPSSAQLVSWNALHSPW